MTQTSTSSLKEASTLSEFRKELHERGILECRKPCSAVEALIWLEDCYVIRERGCTGWDWLRRGRAQACVVLIRAALRADSEQSLK